MKILIANAGSTSLKYRLYELPEETLLAEGRIENIGAPQSRVQHRIGAGNSQDETGPGITYAEAIRRILTVLTNERHGVLASLSELDAVGFKVVHAFRYSGCQILTDAVLAAMEEYVPVASLHNRVYLDAISLFREELPGTPLVGLFETDFHRTIPEHAWRYAIPLQWQEKYGIRRYGFHGASFRYLAGRTPQLTNVQSDDARTILCHLGGSSSVCAIRRGKSLETTMGFSPQSGLPQSTRVGELDAFALLYLLRKGWEVDDLEKEMIQNSGLKGLSGLSGDIPALEKAAAEGHAGARLALEVFAHEIQKAIGAYTAVLQGLDVLVFSGGIGERGAAIRSRICESFGYLGLQIDEKANQSTQGESRISSKDSSVEVWVIPTNEELVVAREVHRLLTGES